MILHLDLDAFFAAAERTRNPKLHGIPIAVGGRSDPFIFDKKTKYQKMLIDNSGAFVQTLFYNTQQDRKSFQNYFVEKDKVRGIVITSSYEARKYGIKIGMSIREALARCPKLTVLSPNHRLYHELSNQLKQYLCTQVPYVEQYSIDEFFADISGWVEEKESYLFCKHLQSEIYTKLGMPISIGIAPTKWIAKLATSFAKPDGIKLITKNEIARFIETIPIERFPGIGRAFQKKLFSYHKNTLGDIKNSKALLYSWKRPGIELYNRVCGLDQEKVEHQRDRKSIGISRTFDPIHERDEIKRRIVILARRLTFMTTKLKLYPATLYFGIKYHYGAKSKKQKTLHRLFHENLLQKESLLLFEALDIYPQSAVMRLTISLCNFQPTHRTYSLLDFDDDQKSHKLLQKTQLLREKYGVDIIKKGIEL